MLVVCQLWSTTISAQTQQEMPRNKWEYRNIDNSHMAVMYMRTDMLYFYFTVQENGPFSMFLTIRDRAILGDECFYNEFGCYTDTVRIDVMLNEKLGKTFHLYKYETLRECQAVYHLDFATWQAMCEVSEREESFFILHLYPYVHRVPISGFAAATKHMNYAREVPINK